MTQTISVQGGISDKDLSFNLVVRGAIPASKNCDVDWKAEGKKLGDLLLTHLAGGTFDAMMFTILDTLKDYKGHPELAAINELRNSFHRAIS